MMDHIFDLRTSGVHLSSFKGIPFVYIAMSINTSGIAINSYEGGQLFMHKEHPFLRKVY